ncbi:hypothetical protein TNCT_698521 [Trichonephila clavata]|uniref:Uncharacterized protein n=1 Tax=Trichonephila clavata TaxID=2740835 RepID=A0A8X6FH68_TRICU|nr:hypothetical protein TNCT_698521 [Trichonephila clavata]
MALLQAKGKLIGKYHRHGLSMVMWTFNGAHGDTVVVHMRTFFCSSIVIIASPCPKACLMSFNWSPIYVLLVVMTWRVIGATIKFTIVHLLAPNKGKQHAASIYPTGR